MEGSFPGLWLRGSVNPCFQLLLGSERERQEALPTCCALLPSAVAPPHVGVPLDSSVSEAVSELLSADLLSTWWFGRNTCFPPARVNHPRGALKLDVYWTTQSVRSVVLCPSRDASPGGEEKRGQDGSRGEAQAVTELGTK